MNSTIVLNGLNGSIAKPPPRSQPAIAYSTNLDFFAVFGGINSNGNALEDTWVLDAPGSWFSINQIQSINYQSDGTTYQHQDQVHGMECYMVL